MTLGQAIRDNRKRLNMSQAELADRIGVSQKVISKYEKGSCRPPIDTVAAMAHVFGLAIDDLVTARSYTQGQSICFEGTLSISDRNYRISLSITPSGEELNG